MALADIIARIGSDASEQASAIEAEARKKAEHIVTVATARAEQDRERSLVLSRTLAERDAETIVVKARLQARDNLVTLQRELIGQALDATAAALAALPDDRYVPWLASLITAAARGGETLALGTLDVGREDAIRAEMARIAPGVTLERSSEPAPFERGAVLRGDRVRADLSLEAIVADRRDELELVVAHVLFAEEA